MKKAIVLSFYVLLIFSVISCKEDVSMTGLADKVTGTYNGTTYLGTNKLPCTSILTKTSDTKVEMTITIDGSSFIFGEIVVYNGGNSTYIICYSDKSGYVNGKVEGKVLTYAVSNGVLNTTFSGTR